MISKNSISANISNNDNNFSHFIVMNFIRISQVRINPYFSFVIPAKIFFLLFIGLLCFVYQKDTLKVPYKKL